MNVIICFIFISFLTLFVIYLSCFIQKNNYVIVLIKNIISTLSGEDIHNITPLVKSCKMSIIISLFIIFISSIFCYDSYEHIINDVIIISIFLSSVCIILIVCLLYSYGLKSTIFSSILLCILWVIRTTVIISIDEFITLCIMQYNTSCLICHTYGIINVLLMITWRLVHISMSLFQLYISNVLISEIIHTSIV